MRVLLVILLLLGALVGGLVHQRVVVTAYLPGLVPGFDLLGMTIRANTDRLAVVDLRAAHTGDTPVSYTHLTLPTKRIV